jgi:hypothetical protein
LTKKLEDFQATNHKCKLLTVLQKENEKEVDQLRDDLRAAKREAREKLRFFPFKFATQGLIGS